MNKFNSKSAASLTALTGFVSIALMIVLAFATVFVLFYQFSGLGVVLSLLNAFASVGIFVQMIFIVTTSQNNSVRGVAALWAMVFGAITLTLVALGSALMTKLVEVPIQFLQIGRASAGILPALGVMSMLSLLPIQRTDPDIYDSIGAAVGHYLMIVAKVAAIMASAAFSFYFGTRHGVPPLVAILACGILELMFVASMNNVGHAHDQRDAFDVGMWTICTVALGAFISLMTVESVSSLASIDVMPQVLRNVGQTIFVSSIGIAMVMFIGTHVLTKFIDIPMAARRAGVRTADVMLRKPDAGWDFRPAGPALPAPAKAHAKVSESGIPYDITGTFVMPQEKEEVSRTDVSRDTDKDITKPLGHIAEQARRENSGHPKA
jgi:hypothetical protein